MNTDLIIIGSGPGGYHTAAYAAACGLKVVVIERSELGGTCLNVGCIPTKTLARNAEVALSFGEAAALGFDAPQAKVDFARMMERKEQVIAQLREGVAAVLSAPGITLVKGEAHFTGAHTVEAGGETWTAPNIIIATGSVSKVLPVEGADLPIVIDSTALLSADRLPERLVIVGAGVIGMEFASIFSALGSKVTVVEFLKECLPALDSDIAKRLRKALEKRGVDFFMQSAVKAITPACVVFDRKGKEQTVEADAVLMAVGRRPSAEGLDIEKAGLTTERGGAIAVDENMQTAVEGIYAVGDVNGQQMLAHAASMQGERAVHHIIGDQDKLRLDIMPAAIFTTPEAACVGMSEDECKSQKTDYKVGRAFYRANGKALAMAETDGMVKLIADASTRRVLGCHCFGAHAADIVQTVSSLMCRDTTVDDIAGMVFIHPTLGEILQDAARAI